MNSYERVMKRLNGEDVDKIPNLNILMAFNAKLIGVPYSKYATDYNCLVEGNLAAAEMFGIDCVTSISDPAREASGFGSEIVLPHDDIPYVKAPLITDIYEIDSIKTVDPYGSERMLDRIKSCEAFKKQVKGKYPIIGWVEGVLAEASDLLGISELMVNLMVEKEALGDLMEKIYPTQLAFAKAQLDAGADIIGIGDAVASLIGPELYSEFALPYEKMLIDEIHKHGGKTKLHICGNIQPLLPQIATLNSDIVDIDWMVDWKTSVDTLEAEGCISSANGNIDPVAVMMQGDLARVEETVKNRLAVPSKRCMISGGCEIPASSPHENMIFMNKLLYKK